MVASHRPTDQRGNVRWSTSSKKIPYIHIYIIYINRNMTPWRCGIIHMYIHIIQAYHICLFMLCFDQGPFLLPKDIGFFHAKIQGPQMVFVQISRRHTVVVNRSFKPNSKLSTAFFLAARIDDKAPAFMYLAWCHPATMFKKSGPPQTIKKNKDILDPNGLARDIRLMTCSTLCEKQPCQ